MYRPKHRTQLWRPVTGQFDCGPRTWQHAIDFARRCARQLAAAAVVEARSALRDVSGSEDKSFLLEAAPYVIGRDR